MSEVVRTLRHELVAIESDVEKLRAEVEKLQARLSHSFEKAGSIKALLALYANEQTEAPQGGLFADVSVPSPTHADVPDKSHVRDNDGSVSKATRVKTETVALLRERGSVHRLKILEHLVGLSVMGHEKNPIASLAAYLSDNRDLFVTDGKGVFALRQPGHQEPSPARNNAGSAGATNAPSDEAAMVPSTLSKLIMGGEV